jgi:hypothetical protein
MCDDDHFPVGRGQTNLLFHQGVIIGHKGAELIRTMSQGKQYIRDKAKIFFSSLEDFLEVFRQIFKFGYRVSTDTFFVSLMIKSFSVCSFATILV